MSAGTSHVTLVRLLDVLTLEPFAWYLLRLCLKVSHLRVLALETFGAIWTLLIKLVLGDHASIRVSTSSAGSHWYSATWNILRRWTSSSATCSHTYSRRRLELFNGLTISHAHILLLVGAVDGLLVLDIILLLIHISARIQNSSRASSSTGANVCLGDVLRITICLLDWYRAGCSYRVARLLLVFLLLLNHLTLVHLILWHHVFNFVHLLVLLWLILLLKLLIADRIKLLENIYKHGFLCFNISLICVPNKVHIYFTISSFSLGLDRSMEGIFFIELVKIFVTNFWGNLWDVAGCHFSKLIPFKSFEKWMSFDLFDTVSAKSCIRVTNEPLENICRSWR